MIWCALVALSRVAPIVRLMRRRNPNLLNLMATSVAAARLGEAAVAAAVGCHLDRLGGVAGRSTARFLLSLHAGHVHYVVQDLLLFGTRDSTAAMARSNLLSASIEILW